MPDWDLGLYYDNLKLTMKPFESWMWPAGPLGPSSSLGTYFFNITGCNTHCHTPNNPDNSNEPDSLLWPTDHPRLSHHFHPRTTTTATTSTADSCATSSSSCSASPCGLRDLRVVVRVVVHRGRHVAVWRLFVTKTGEKIFAQCYREKISTFYQRQDIGAQESRRRRWFKSNSLFLFNREKTVYLK